MSQTSLILKSDIVAAQGKRAETSKRTQILLVEGDGFTRLVLLLRLRMAGFGVEFTSNGILGLEKLRNRRPDVLLVELRLCGLSGLELMKAARADSSFGNRPIYVFTHVDRMNRGALKQVKLLATRLFDKGSITHERLVQNLAAELLSHEKSEPQPVSCAEAKPAAEALDKMAVPGEMEEIIAGVRDEFEQFAKCNGPEARAAAAGRLLSRVSSLASSAETAGLLELAWNAKDLEKQLSQLRIEKQGYNDADLSAIGTAIAVMSRIYLEATGEVQRPLQSAAATMDDFELLPQPSLQEEASVLDAPAQSVSQPGEVIHEPNPGSAQILPWESAMQDDAGQAKAAAAEAQQADQHPVGSIHNGPEFQAESSATDGDSAAEMLARLPSAMPIDGSQIDERPIEELPPSDPQTEAPPLPQLEPTAESQSDEAARLAAAAADTGQAVPSPETMPEFHDNNAEAVQETVAATKNYEEAMNDPLQAFPAEYAQPGQPNQQSQVQNAQENRPADPATEAAAAEMMFYPAQGSMQRSDQPMEAPQDPFAEAAPDRGVADHPAEQSAAEQRALARCAELELEVTTLRQAFEGFNGSFGQEQQAAADANQQIKELEERLQQGMAELEKQKAEQQRVETELLRQQEAGNVAGRQSEAAREQAEALCAQLGQELETLRQTRDELTGKLAQEQKANAESAEQLRKLEAELQTKEAEPGASAGSEEQQIRERVAALARATAELAKERGERQRSDQRAAELNGRLQAMHEDLRRMLQTQREDQARISVLEEQEHQARQTLDQRTAELEQQTDERRIAEEQLQKAKDVSTQLRNDLSFFEAANKNSERARQELQGRLESSLSAARENEARLQQEGSERQRLAVALESAQRELQELLRKRETLEQELQTARDALQDRETKLQKEAAERERLTQALDASQRSLRADSERDLEISKLQSALNLEQIERNRQETQLARLHRSALESARAARVLRTSLRRQVREPIDNLIRSAQSLLELETGEEHKKLAEAVLQDVLLVHTRLREPEPAPTEPAGATEPPATTEA